MAGKEGQEPALCESCKAEEGTAARVYLEVLAEVNLAESRHHAASATCSRCHSGGQLGAVLCENGECAVLYSRLSTSNRLATASSNWKRLDW